LSFFAISEAKNAKDTGILYKNGFFCNFCAILRVFRHQNSQKCLKTEKTTEKPLKITKITEKPLKIAKITENPLKITKITEKPLKIAKITENTHINKKLKHSNQKHS
jgi:hypothetical protein